ncbi:NAD(P)-dependent oxidoreductase [Acuticoccus mangrovi]|uniref:NAD(P)-dependent oxidoreductase n=1 Tax=Acuticoccus mangrovi TaxID=2796142 RepID=A0A934ILK6_9HYPH|nr:NAD(P)-dependent oxidoreductase [Acuticoccus mangrovi]MBJ3774875.1 NAD(P)-dependent oxidoreductase [Acuticoccus mangrovi]
MAVNTQVAAERPSVLMIGYGEVGQAFAQRVAGAGAALQVVDRLHAGESVAGVTVAAEPPASLAGVDMVLAAVPSSVSVAVAEAYAALPGDFVYVDLSSSAEGAMREAAARFAGRKARFADAAIMGSVNLHGAGTPLIIAGEGSDEAADHLEAFGFEVTRLTGGKAGDASALKLLRSVLTKGLEAVAVECFVAARAMGLSDALRDNLSDIGRTSFPDFLDAIIRTHVVHAPRRAHEVAGAVAQLEERDLPASVSRAVLDAFHRTSDRLVAAAPAQPPKSADEALAWLSGETR